MTQPPELPNNRKFRRKWAKIIGVPKESVKTNDPMHEGIEIGMGLGMKYFNWKIILLLLIFAAITYIAYKTV